MRRGARRPPPVRSEPIGTFEMLRGVGTRQGALARCGGVTCEREKSWVLHTYSFPRCGALCASCVLAQRRPAR
eukprot:3887129-Prymnesium_polylepis.3